MRRIYQSRLLLSTLRRPLSSSSAPPPPRRPLILPRTRTPLETQFESWITKLQPGFSPSDVEQALLAQSDPDLALDIFRWTAQRPNYKHTHQTYLTMLRIAVSGRRDKATMTLVEEVLEGACSPHLDLFNYMIDFCCSRRHYSRRAFDIYKKMLASKDSKPNLETFTMLFDLLLNKFGKADANRLYLSAVRSLNNQMKACGVKPNTFVLNNIISAYSLCLEVDEGMTLLRQMSLYGCQPNGHSYSSLIKALCEKEMLNSALALFEEMKGKSLVPNSIAYNVLVCSLTMEKRFDEASEVVFEMLGNSMSPDFLTYETLLDEMCRDGRGDKALDLVEQFKERDRHINERTYPRLLDMLNIPSSR